MRSIQFASVSALVLALAAPCAAFAQDAQGTSVDEVIVTARRVEERLQDVPLAITAITGNDLAARGVTKFYELGQTTPGLTVSSHAGRSISSIVGIRAQRGTETPSTASPAVAVYFDNMVVAPVFGNSTGLFDLANVQILKGPQGTLFGRNTTGGAILFTTADPANEFGGELKAGIGNYSLRQAEGFVNLPVTDNLRARLSLYYYENDGYGKIVAAPGANPGPAVGYNTDDRNEFSARLKVIYDPTDQITSKTTVYYSQVNNDGPSASFVKPINPAGNIAVIFGQAGRDAILAQQSSSNRYNKASTVVPYERAVIKGLINETSFKLSDSLTLKNIAGYRQVRYKDNFDYDSTILSILEASNNSKAHLFTEEFQLIGSLLDDRLTYVAGAYYYHENTFEYTSPVRTFGGLTSYGGDIHNRSYSAFFQTDYKLTDSLTATAGIRYTKDKRFFGTSSFRGTYENPTSCTFTGANGAFLPVNACRLDNRVSASKPTWLLGLNQKFGDDTMVYISHRRGYRSGGFNHRASTNAVLTPFSPEIVTDVEVGFKNTTRFGDDWSLTSSGAAYYQWYKDIQRTVTAILGGGNIGSLLKNAASADVYGAELDLTVRKGRMLTLGAAYSYVKPKYNDFPLLATVGGVANQPTNYKDRTFGNTPHNQLNFNGKLTFDTDAGELNLIGNAYYQSKAPLGDEYSNLDQLRRALTPAAAALIPANYDPKIPSRWVANLRAELNNIGGSDVSVAAWVNNVADKRYITGGSLLYVSLGADLGSFGPPRTYGFEVKTKF